MKSTGEGEMVVVGDRDRDVGGQPFYTILDPEYRDQNKRSTKRIRIATVYTATFLHSAS